MSLQIITGDLSVDKKSRIIERILEINQQNPNAEIYYLVPDHLKFDMETLMLENIQRIKGKKQSVMMNIQVASFSRLTWFLLKGQKDNRQHLSSVGVKMILRQILEENQHELKVFRGQIQYHGFLVKLMEIFEEFIKGQIDPTILADYLDNHFSDSAQQTIEYQKLAEIKFLYERYDQKLKTLDLDPFTSDQVLIDYLSNHSTDRKLFFVIDHHYYFNAEQMSLVLNLIRYSEQVMITLPLSHYEANNHDYQPLLETPHYTYHLIKRLCQLNGLSVLADWDINEPSYAYQSFIKEIANTFKNRQHMNNKSVRTVTASIPAESIEIWENDTLQTEIRHVSNQIHYLVSQGKYRYRDILVVTRDIERYQAMIRPIFAMNKIPVFIDHRTSMSQHGFVLLLDALLHIKTSHWNYNNIMTILNSDLIIPDFLQGAEQSLEDIIIEKRHQVNYLENILLENGYFSYRLTDQSFQWTFENQERFYCDVKGQVTQWSLKEMAETWRSWIIQHLFQPHSKLQSRASGHSTVSWLYHWTRDLGIEKQIIALRDHAVEQGDIQLSRHYEQVWNQFVDLLDEFHQIYSKDLVSFELFRDLILVGLNEASFHVIPASLDQVTFTNMVSPQVKPYRVCFVIGADNQSLPSFYPVSSLLDSHHRESLKEYLLPHQYLMKIEEQQFSQELLLFYQLLLSAKEKLYISYTKIVNEAQLKISPYVSQLLHDFEIPIYQFTSETIQQIDRPHSSSFGRFPMVKSLIVQGHRLFYQDKSDYSPRYSRILNTVRQDVDYKNNLDHLFQAIFQSQNIPVAIQSETALQLYGRDLTVSVSKIEDYCRDPFSHFLLHGLKLKERRPFELDYAKTGDYFHEYLDILTQTILDNQLDLNNLQADQLSQLFNDIESTLQEDLKYNILSSSAQFESIQRHLNTSMQRFVKFMAWQKHYSLMDPIRSEAIFGINPKPGHLLGFQYPLQSGGQLAITGKIDRIDKVSLNQQEFLQVIDYKSSDKSFNLVDLYYGLDLQILTYLGVALHNISHSKPFGGFYQPVLHKYHHVQDKLIGKEDSLSEIHLSENKPKGFALASLDVLSQTDKSLEKLRTKSLIYPVQIKNNGEFYQSSLVFSQAEIDIMIRYVQHKFVEAANQIQTGNIQLAPYYDERYTPSILEEFRVISGFDPRDHFSYYRHKLISKEEALQDMKAQLSSKEE